MRASCLRNNGLLVGGLCGALVFSAWVGQAAEVSKELPPPRVEAPGEGPRVFMDVVDGVLRAGPKGGSPATVGNIVKQVQAQVPEGNFVLSPGVSEVVISNLVLRNASLLGAMKALGYASGNEVQASEVAPGVYAVMGRPPVRKNKEKAVEAYNLSAKLDSIGPRDSEKVREWMKELNTLVITTLKAYDGRTGQGRETPLLNFNENTGVLVIIGQPEQLEIAGKIVKAASQISDQPARVQSTLELLRNAKEESGKGKTEPTPAETPR